MSVFRLPEDNIFPPPHLSDSNGLLAVGGDLSESRLLKAYSMGIFPWYSEGDPILWWSPDPRLVLFPDELKVSRSLRQAINRGIFRVTMDQAFDSVIRECASVHRKGHGDTWITEDMINAYINLHRTGHAHSVEAWSDGELSGGLYGVSMGSAFFGESMFTKVSNASKVAFVLLVNQLIKWNFTLIDCQVTTHHLKNLGAREIPRSDFLARLALALDAPSRQGIWKLDVTAPVLEESTG
jgi:leucyl/phenylalanyl-tRNA--protein transferase